MSSESHSRISSASPAMSAQTIGSRSPAVINSNIENSLSHQAYLKIKDRIFCFSFLPGDRFSENQLVDELSMSRTPIREALFRLRREGYVDVLYRAGWQVRPFDFEQFEALYDTRIVLETASVQRIGAYDPDTRQQALVSLMQRWCVAPALRENDSATMLGLDEDFHQQLVILTGNREMARIHYDITERIRVIRRLDYGIEGRVDATYNEHAAILQAIADGDTAQAVSLLVAHINQSKRVVRQVTLHMLQEARTRLGNDK